jgi:hypothetical protein
VREYKKDMGRKEREQTTTIKKYDPTLQNKWNSPLK